MRNLDIPGKEISAPILYNCFERRSMEAETQNKLLHDLKIVKCTQNCCIIKLKKLKHNLSSQVFPIYRPQVSKWDRLIRWGITIVAACILSSSKGVISQNQKIPSKRYEHYYYQSCSGKASLVLLVPRIISFLGNIPTFHLFRDLFYVTWRSPFLESKIIFSEGSQNLGAIHFCDALKLTDACV